MNDKYDHKKKHDHEAEPQSDPAPGNGPGSEERPESEGVAEEDRATVLQRQLDECQSRLLRSAADYQNTIRRSQGAVQEAREQQLLEISKSLINVLDHFDRALEIDLTKVPAQNLVQGVKIVRDELNKLLEGFGIRRIEAKVGEEFNPGGTRPCCTRVRRAWRPTT